MRGGTKRGAPGAGFTAWCTGRCCSPPPLTTTARWVLNTHDLSWELEETLAVTSAREIDWAR